MIMTLPASIQAGHGRALVFRSHKSFTLEHAPKCVLSRLTTCRDCRGTVTARAAAETSTSNAQNSPSPEQEEWVPVMKPEDLPKGIRKEVTVQGIGVLIFWYRNQLYAIENRSPAEGAYSEGFANAKFTQDYGIECPSTKSVFSLKTGEIIDWYPNNPVLRVLTPSDTCRPLDIYPVKMTQDAIQVDIADASTTRSYASTRGGSDTSIDKNNVYALQPKSYLQGTEAPGGQIESPTSDTVSQVATLTVAILAVGGSAVAGTAFFLYKESFIGLGIFWVALFATSAAFVVQYKNDQTEKIPKASKREDK